MIDYQFFNTEIFYGINGEVFPKYSICKLYDLKEVEIDKPEQSKIIFLILPIKQEIETNKLHSFQRKFSVCNNHKNFELFSSKFQKDDINMSIFTALSVPTINSFINLVTLTGMISELKKHL